MAVTYDSSLVYCNEEDVFRYAARTFLLAVSDPTTNPTAEEVYEYAKDVAAKVESQTELAGNRITPTESLSEPVRVQRVLEQANAVGAALLAWIHMDKCGEKGAERTIGNLARQYEALMGPGSSGGGFSAGTGDGTVGDVADAVSGSSGSNLLANEVTEGEVTLKSLTTREDVEPVFTIEDED